MSNVIQFAGAREEISLEFFQGGLDGKSQPISLLSQQGNLDKVIVPNMVIYGLFRLLTVKGLSPEMNLLMQQMSRPQGATVEAIRRFAELIVEDGGVSENPKVTSLAEKIIANSLMSPREIEEDLRDLQRDDECDPMLAKFIGKLLDELVDGDQVDWHRRGTRVALHAYIEFGTMQYTDPDLRCPTAEVVLGCRQAFQKIVGVARNDIYHPQDLAAFFELERPLLYENARIILAVPITPPDCEPGLAKRILLKQLLVGGHLDAEKTSSVLDTKIQNAEVIDADAGLRHITLNTDDLLACGMSEDLILDEE